MFLCPNCNAKIQLPKCINCGYEVPKINSIYCFCDAPAVKLEGEDQYIGYDNIGEDFEPAIAYWNANNTRRYGVYEACSDLVAEQFGRNIVALDLGAGLGTASIPLAQNGIQTIAADISSVMLSTAVKRGAGRFANLTLAQMNAYHIMLADSSVDVVVENAMLHLVDHPEKVIEEILRVLKPNGCLIRYGSYGQPLTDEEGRLNQYCNSILEDISDRYFAYLQENGVKGIWFDNHLHEVMEKYFLPPKQMVAKGFSEVFTEKLKFRLHRLKNGAHSDLQNIQKELLATAWQHADRYAKEKYGDAYREIQGFSRYGAQITIYCRK